MPSKIEFVNCHHHTTLSTGDGFGTPKEHVARAVELGYSAAAVTEHGNVSSFFMHEKACIKAGIKPLFGLEAYCGAVDPEHRSQYKYHLTILARDAVGYRNLNRIVTQSYLDHHYHPTVSGKSLADNSRGIIALSGCSGSLLACTLLGGKGTPERIDDPDWEGAEDVIWKFHDLFGDRYYLEVQPFYELEKSCAMNRAYERLSKITGVPLVVTNDVHYPRIEDAEMQAVLHATHRGKHTVDEMLRSWNYEVPCTLPSSDKELLDRLLKTGLTREAARTAIASSANIADMCNVTLPKAERLHYPISESDLEPWDTTRMK
jgi:DNA polymerase III subunit alpha